MWTTDYKIGEKKGEEIKRAFPGLCSPNSDDKLTFGLVVNVDAHGSSWKSHMSILGENCDLLDAFDFPDDTTDCDDYAIPRADYMPYDLIVNNVNRPSGRGQFMASSMEIDFAYGSGQYLDHRQCSCGSHLEEFHGGDLEPDNSDIEQQWFCKCQFAKNGDGSWFLQGMDICLDAGDGEIRDTVVDKRVV